MKEVEILVEVLGKKEETLDILEQFNFVGVKDTLDIYFYDPKRDDLRPGPGSRLLRSFRLRKKGDKNFLAYKIDNFNEKGGWLYSDEHEVEISDFETMVEILKHLGLEILVEIENEKHIYLTDKYEIVFEDVKNLGLFLEVEQLNCDGDVVKIKKEIWNFIESLDIKIGKELNAGKPELMLQKISKAI